MDSQTQMKQVVADAAIRKVESGMILGLGSGSTAALMIKIPHKFFCEAVREVLDVKNLVLFQPTILRQ